MKTKTNIDELLFKELGYDLSNLIYQNYDKWKNEQQLSKKCGLSQSKIRNVLTRKYNPTLKEIIQICKAINIRPMLTGVPLSRNSYVKFMNPHSGSGGAAIPLPKKVKQYAHEINGHTDILNKVFNTFKIVFPSGKFQIDRDMITMSFVDKKNGYTHFWKVIEFQ